MRVRIYSDYEPYAVHRERVVKENDGRVVVYHEVSGDGKLWFVIDKYVINEEEERMSKKRPAQKGYLIGALEIKPTEDGKVAICVRGSSIEIAQAATVLTQAEWDELMGLKGQITFYRRRVRPAARPKVKVSGTA